MSRAVDDPWQYALDALGRRDQTAREIRDRLRRRNVDAESADTVVARLIERDYVDDRRVAYNHARFRKDQARRGPRRVRAELLARGIAPSLADEAVRDSFPDSEGRETLERTAERLAGTRGLPEDRPGRERLARRLATAGFPHAEVLAWLAAGPAGRTTYDDID